MIPLIIHIKNFLSYGDTLQKIDFGPYPLICLSGKNGHGKSALLDAITWAIWGQARKVFGIAKADASLLRLGQTHMIVVLDFSLNGEVYRIRREYTHQGSKAQLHLDFGIVRPDTQLVVPLTDKTIRLTQDKIEKVLRLDYDTFVNSAFLRQGNSNEFSKKTAKERKDILTTILGFNQYEDIRKKALEKIKHLTAERTTLLALRESTSSTVEKKQQIAEQIRDVQMQLAHLQVRLIDRKETMAFLGVGITLLQAAERLSLQYTERIQALQKKKQDAEQSLYDAMSAWREVHAKQQSYEAVAPLTQQRLSLMQEIHIHQTRLQQWLCNQEELLRANTQKQQLFNDLSHKHLIAAQHLERQREKISSEYDGEMRNKNSVSVQVRAHSDALDRLEVSCAQLIQEINRAQALHDAYQSNAAHVEKRKEYYHMYGARTNSIRTSLNEHIARATVIVQDTDDCPLCEQSVSGEQKARMHRHIQEKVNHLSYMLGRYTRVTDSLASILAKQRTVEATQQKNQELLVTLKTQLEERMHSKESLQVLCAKMKHDMGVHDRRITELHVLLQEVHNALCNHELQGKLFLQNDGDYRMLLARIEHLESERALIGYDSSIHDILRKKLQVIEETLAQVSLESGDYTAQQKTRRAAITSLCNALKEIKQDIIDFEQWRDDYASLVPLQHTYVHTYQDHENAQKADQEIKDQYLHVIGRLQEAHEQCLGAETLYLGYSEKITVVERDLSEYQMLSNALSKDGIPALLIEQVIPEIEYETNRLLKKLTNNQSHVIIDSLRDLKNGSLKETLDIKISDAAGVRPYELFSGGEAFRIDFALRIALARLLARRSGTTLQTLIIDEGFGSQDDDGLNAIMDALYKIQDDFAKIIIVSHLPAMKDQFPVHFMVHKGAHGSSITLMEQG